MTLEEVIRYERKIEEEQKKTDMMKVCKKLLSKNMSSMILLTVQN